MMLFITGVSYQAQFAKRASRRHIFVECKSGSDLKDLWAFMVLQAQANGCPVRAKFDGLVIDTSQYKDFTELCHTYNARNHAIVELQKAIDLGVRT